MKSKHTPAPWATAGRSGNDGEAFIIEGNTPHFAPNRTICWTALGGEGENPTPQDIANACLIATAPELLAALRRAEAALSYFIYDEGESDVEALNEARAAIAKAEGRA